MQRLLLAFVCSVCLCATGCAQRVGAVVEAAAPAGYTPHGERCVLLTPPPLALAPAWEEIRPLLDAQLRDMGYTLLPDAAVPPDTAQASTPAAAPTPSPAALPASHSTSQLPPAANATTDAPRTASPAPALPAAASRATVVDAASPSASAAADVPQVAVRVYWDESGPFTEYVPAPLDDYPRWGRYGRSRHYTPFGGIWAADPFARRYIAEEKYMRRLIVEAVSNSMSDPAAHMPLSARECLQDLPAPPDRLLWRTIVTSKGNLSRAGRILPELTRAALPWLGKSGIFVVRVQGEDVQVLAGD